jgi:hypothetical protein
MATHLTINFPPTTTPASRMAPIKTEEEPLDDDARCHLNQRMIEAVERLRLAKEEIAAIEKVVIEDNNKNARRRHHYHTLNRLPLPSSYEDDIYQWETIHEVMVAPNEGATRRRQYVYNWVRPGTLVKLTTGKEAGLTGFVVGMWNKTQPEVAKNTMWWIQLHETKKVVRRQQKFLLLTDTYSGY